MDLNSKARGFSEIPQKCQPENNTRNLLFETYEKIKDK